MSSTATKAGEALSSTAEKLQMSKHLETAKKYYADSKQKVQQTLGIVGQQTKKVVTEAKEGL